MKYLKSVKYSLIRFYNLFKIFGFMHIINWYKSFLEFYNKPSKLIERFSARAGPTCLK